MPVIYLRFSGRAGVTYNEATVLDADVPGFNSQPWAFTGYLLQVLINESLWCHKALEKTVCESVNEGCGIKTACVACIACKVL